MTVSTPLGNPSEERALLAHAYFDGELDPVNALAVGRQVAADPAANENSAIKVAIENFKITNPEHQKRLVARVED